MTTAFQVTDVAMLKKSESGDKVGFVAANPEGKLTLTEIRLAEWTATRLQGAGRV